MEQVLYEYHITQALISNLSDEETYKAKLYMESVYANNGITEEEFDSSMAYYNRHTEDLKDIYDNLHERLTVINEKIQLQTGNNEMMTFSENGDTTNIWGGKKLLLLRNKDILNKETFVINADSSVHNGDKFILKSNIKMINEEKRSRNYRVTMCLVVQYSDGKQVSEYQHITSTSEKQITLNTDKNKSISQISGFFYYSGKDEERNFTIINDIELIKIHTQKRNDTPPTIKDSEPVSIEEETINKPTVTHTKQINTIEELNRKRIEENRKIDIKSSPEKIRRHTGPIINRNINRK
jgi:hypothetical protein